MSDKDEIEVFFGWVENKREDVLGLAQESFRRILPLSLLDTIAKCAFPKERKPGKRFVTLIDSYSEWKHKDRVSLIQLGHLLKRSTEDEYLELRNEVERQMQKWPPKGFGRIPWSEQYDPLLKDLDSFKKGKCASLTEKARYAVLLWQMRNFAVHELRIVGQTLPDPHDFDEPYYSAYLNVETQQREWELNIPTIVISKLIGSCSERLKAHLEENGTNPFDSFDDGLSWYPD